VHSSRSFAVIVAAQLIALGSAVAPEASQPSKGNPSAKCVTDHCGKAESQAAAAATRSQKASLNSTACDELKKHHVKLFPYSFMQALPFKLRYGPAIRLEASDGMAKIDLNNDGIPLSPMALTYDEGFGR
jgi:hypothetical protein